MTELDKLDPAPDLGHRPIRVIAKEITRVWMPEVWFGAVPYLRAMRTLDTLNDNYGEDDAETILMYFLSNAKYWRGPDAKRIKAELRAILAAK
jgi:hypothetical protein